MNAPIAASVAVPHGRLSPVRPQVVLHRDRTRGRTRARLGRPENLDLPEREVEVALRDHASTTGFELAGLDLHDEDLGKRDLEILQLPLARLAARQDRRRSLRVGSE